MTEWIWQVDPADEREKLAASSRITLAKALKQIFYREQENWFLWLPVGLAFGTAAYFSLMIEPSWLLAVTLLVAAVVLVILVRKHTIALVFSIFTLAVAAGFILAKINSERITAPVIQKRIGPVMVKGRIENVFSFASGDIKIIVRPDEISRLKPENLPHRLRLKLRKNQVRAVLLPGQYIEAKAIIFPPPEPTHPGGFDFARKSWFEGIGGSGFLITVPKIVTNNLETSIYVRAAASLAKLRQRISARLKSQLGDEKGGLAAALIVGDRAALSKTTVSTLRDAGLAHLLAISGLHMVLFAGTIFWLLRAVLALNATVLLHWPVKKWAAGGAMIGAGYYLAISGASIATQRAFIMITIMFLAIMLDRPAITLRNIAIAAVIILVIKPVSLLSISFQMSFAATTFLVAFYEWYRKREVIRLYSSSSPVMRGLYVVLFYISGIALTTLIAGLATSPFAAFYFQRIAVFSLVANVLALPVIGFVVMPAGLIGLLLMPLGLDGFALAIMGAGLEMVMAIATWTSSLPNAVQITPAFSGSALLLMVFGALWLCLWQTQWRVLGIGLIIAGIAITPLYSLPDVYISASARNIAVRGNDGLLVVAKAGREKFSVEKWLTREGDTISPKEAARREGFRCDAKGCVFTLSDNRLISFTERLAAVEEDCTRVEVLIAMVPIRGECEGPQVKIDKFDLWRNGAYTITYSGADYVIQNVRDERGQRPWVRERGNRKRYETKR